MSFRKEQGFSLIELLLVVVIIGIVAAMAVPAYRKGLWAAQNGSAFSILRTISSTQVTFYSQNGRFGRLAEINSTLNNGVGTEVDGTIVRGTYVFSMPDEETDEQLKTKFRVTARRDVAGDVLYMYELNEGGQIIQVFPEGAPAN